MTPSGGVGPALGQPKHGRDGVQDKLRVGQRAQGGDPHAVGEFRQQTPPKLHALSGLAGTAAGQSGKPMRRNKVREFGEYGLEADETGGWRRRVCRRRSIATLRERGSARVGGC